MSNISTVAKREMAREKARLSGKRTRKPYPLEKNVERGEEFKEPEQRVKEQSFKSVSPEDFTVAAQQSRSRDDFDWRQYQPGSAEGIPEQKPISLNSATIRSIAKKLIAREWRKARGTPKRDARIDQLEQTAATWQERKEMKRKKVELEKQKLDGYMNKLNEVLVEFSSRPDEQWDDGEDGDLTAMFQEELKWAGNPYKLEWSEDGCRIWYEPWEETRIRKISKIADPVIYTAFIDKEMNIASLDKNEDGNFLPKVREENLTADFKELLDERSPSNGEIDGLLQEAIEEVGRIVSFNRTHSGWIAAVEPWERMRLRKIQKEDEAHASVTRILIDVTDGEFRFKIESY